MKKLSSLYTIIIPVLLFSGCLPSPRLVPAASPTAQLSVVYACAPVLPYSSTVVVYDTSRFLFSAQNDASVLNGTGGVPAGSNVNLTFKTGNGSVNNILYTNGFNLVANNNYSMFFGGPVTNPCQLFIQNDLTAPASGMARVRFVNLSSDTSSFNVFYGSVKVASGLTYQSVSPVFEVPADSMASFTFVNAAIPAITIPTGTFLLGSGGICIIVLAGNNGVQNFSLCSKIISLNSKVIL